MAHLSWKKLQRGETLKIMISVLRIGGDEADVQTEPIDVGSHVKVILKFKCGMNNEINSSIRMRGKTGIQASTQIKIISGKFNEVFFCSNKWVEAEMYSKPFDKNVIINNQNTLSYFIEVDICVYLIGTLVVLPNYYLYKDTEFTDCELQATDGNVAVHKTTLMAHSDVFKTMMGGEWKEKAEGCIKIDGVTVQTLQHMKDFLYLGNLPDEGLESLLVVAARYLMNIMVSQCIRKLVHSMKPENFDELVKLACQHNIPELVKALVFRIPDDIINGIHQLQISDQEPKDDDNKTQ